MSSIGQAVGAAVRARREALGWSQEGLGFRAGLDRTYVSGVERGVRNPTLETLSRLSDAFECNLSELIADAEARSA